MVLALTLVFCAVFILAKCQTLDLRNLKDWRATFRNSTHVHSVRELNESGMILQIYARHLDLLVVFYVSKQSKTAHNTEALKQYIQKEYKPWPCHFPTLY